MAVSTEGDARERATRPVGRLLAVLSWGLQRYPPDVARRAKILNAVALFSVASQLLFLGWFQYVSAERLREPSIVLLLVALFTPITILINRVSVDLAILYYCLLTAAHFAVTGTLVGGDAGTQYFLLASPAGLLVVGIKRLARAGAFLLLFVAAFVQIEYLAPRQGLMPAEFIGINRLICAAGTLSLLFVTIYYALKLATDAEEALEKEYERSEWLLLNLMPASIAARLKAEPNKIIADQFEAVTILFADIVDFTPRAGRLPPDEIVTFLNTVFSAFDRLADRHGLEKIKTIGDAYMVAGGMPDRRSGHAEAVAAMALDMLEEIRRLSAGFGEELSVRVGIHAGPAVAGVIGTRKLFYDVWGDTVNTASRMESHGAAGRIQVTEAAKAALGPGFVFEERGVVPVKGKGEMRVFYLVGKVADAA